MSWRENLLPGALDGVQFLFSEVGTEGGRRGEVHEFPGRDIPFSEDLGRAARRYHLRAFLIGDDYQDTRDALQDLLESGRDLLLTHPYKGDFTVKHIGIARTVERDTEGGYCEIDFTLVEAGIEFPLVRINTARRLKFLAADARKKLSTKTKFSLLGAIGAVLKSIAGAFETAASALRKVNGKIGGALSLVDNVTSAIDAFGAQINTLLSQPQALMNTLVDLVDTALRLITQFAPEPQPLGVREEAVELVKLTREALAELFAFETAASAIPTPTQQSKLEHAAHEQMNLTMKGAALASGAEILAELELESADQPQAIAQDLAVMFEEILSADLDESVLQAFASLKAASVEHFNAVAQALPQVTTYTPPTTTVALVLAYDLYGDADLEDDVIRRNKIRHPAFVLGGRPLEVLADE